MVKRTKSELQVENWNLKHPAKTPVTVCLDSGEVKRTITRSEAYLAASGDPVIFLENVRGYYLLDRVSPIVGEAA